MQFAAKAHDRKAKIEQELSHYIGKKIYKTGYTELFPPTTELNDLLDSTKRRISIDRHIENLVQLKIIDTKLIDSANAVVLRVELPNGDTRLLFGQLTFYDKPETFKQTVLQKMGISAEERIPSKFTKKEIANIREGRIFIGMSEDALYWARGYPEQTNNWGKGGEQLIYSFSRYVYLQGGIIRDFQNLE
jgi:hypothetical protein